MKAKPTSMLRIADVAKKTALDKSTIWEKVKKEQFPKPYKHGKVTAWKESDVDEWIEQNYTQA